VGAYIIRRLGIAIPVLLGITLIGFLAQARQGPAPASINPEVWRTSPEPESWNSNGVNWLRPVFPISTCGGWLGSRGPGVLTSPKRSIAYEIGSRLPQTLYLMVVALVLACIGSRWASARSSSIPRPTTR
jgi:ABC-type dipeptide/oligopeptide/nickel transport system permease component